jgi:hypothetical protein
VFRRRDYFAAISGARSELARLDEQEPEVIQKHRDIEVQRMPQ